MCGLQKLSLVPTTFHFPLEFTHSTFSNQDTYGVFSLFTFDPYKYRLSKKTLSIFSSSNLLIHQTAILWRQFWVKAFVLLREKNCFYPSIDGSATVSRLKRNGAKFMLHSLPASKWFFWRTYVVWKKKIETLLSFLLR